MYPPGYFAWFGYSDFFIQVTKRLFASRHVLQALFQRCYTLFCVQDCADAGWWMGEIGGRQGVFPDNFVKLLEAEKEVTVAFDIKLTPDWDLLYVDGSFSLRWRQISSFLYLSRDQRSRLHPAHRRQNTSQVTPVIPSVYSSLLSRTVFKHPSSLCKTIKPKLNYDL